MWVHFDFLCNVDTQIRLHKIFRSRISEWKDLLIDGSVLTYHFRFPRTTNDSLYVCLNIPSISLPTSRNICLSESQENQLPETIRNTMVKLSSEYLINPMDKLERKDYEFEVMSGDTTSKYNASVEQILSFASNGTAVALELLNHDRTREEKWETDKEIVTTIKQSIDERLTTESERHWGLHFACNSIFLATLIEKYLRGILSQYFDGKGSWALGFLYEIERKGNFEEAVQKFLPIVELNRSYFYQSS